MVKIRLIIGFLLICGIRGVFAQTTAPVWVKQVKEMDISEKIEGHGVIQPYPQNDIKISPISPMRVLSILVKPGEVVHKGELIVQFQRDQAIDVAVTKAKIAFQQAKLNRDRAKVLFENGVIPRVKYEQAQTEFELAKADLEIKKRSLNYAISNSDVKSPIDGIVSSVSGAVGQIADPTQVIVRIVSIKKLIAIIGVEIEDIEKIHGGERALISIPNLSSNNEFWGRVIKLNKEIDPSTQLVHIWISLENPEGILQPGMFAVANIFVKLAHQALVVPLSAVLKDASGKYVFVIEGDKAHKIYVKTGIQGDRAIQILSGVKKGQQVVFLGNYELEDGMQVAVQK